MRAEASIAPRQLGIHLNVRGPCHPLPSTGFTQKPQSFAMFTHLLALKSLDTLNGLMARTPSQFDSEFSRLHQWLKDEGGGLLMNEAALRLGISRIRIAQLTGSGELHTTKFFHHLVISRRSFDAFERRREGLPSYGEPRSNGRSPIEEPVWEETFLATLSSTGSVMDAVRAAGISRQTAYTRRKRDEEFSAAWRDALRE